MIGLTATDARKGLFDIVRGATERHEIYRVHHRSGNVVIMSEAEYDSLLETLDLLSTPGFREGFEQAKAEADSGETVSFEEVFGEAQ